MNKVEKALVILLIILIFIIIVLILSLFPLPEPPPCDYDSCSQESTFWNINGSKCFDYHNPECSEFLKLWDACQHYKDRMGVC
jgi:hypothetical protein